MKVILDMNLSILILMMLYQYYVLDTYIILSQNK
jgi:hypothetical protein